MAKQVILTNGYGLFEKWKRISGFPGYWISSIGRIKTKSNKIYEPKTARYSKVTLIDSEFNIKTIAVHRLVAIAFIPNPKNKPQVNHKNGDKTNNRVENLEYVTPGDNTRHARFVLGEFPFGSRNGKARFDEREVREIRRQVEAGEATQAELARRHSVAKTTISAIVNRVNWRHI